jgi:DNA-directed RNA polymerase specialized sigma24 family protein
MKDKELLNLIKQRIGKNPYYYQIKDKTDRDTIINDLFMSVWEKIRDGSMSDDWEEIKGYVFISGRNNCLNYLRKKRNEVNRTVDIDLDGSNNFKYDEGTERMEYFDRMAERLDFIKKEVRDDIDSKIITMRMNGYQLSDIAKELDLSVDEVERYNRSIVRYIRERYYNPRFKKHARHWGKLRAFVYTVEDTHTNNFVEYVDKEKIAKDLGTPKKRINEYIDNGRLINGRYKINVQKKMMEK